MSTTQDAETNELDTNNLTRREMMRLTGAGALAAGGLAAGGQYAPVQQGDAIAPAVAVAVVAGASAGGVAGYVIGKSAGGDAKEIQKERANDLHANIHADMLELSRQVQSHINTYNDIAELVKSDIRVNVGHRITRAVEAGKSKSETISQVEAEIDDVVAEYQRNHLTEWDFAAAAIGRRHNLAVNQSQLTETDVIELTDPSGNQSRTNAYPFGDFSSSTNQTKDYQLVDGNTKTSFGPATATGDSYQYSLDIDPTDSRNTVVTKSLNSDETEVLSTPNWYNIWTDLQNLASNQKTEAANLVDQMYQPLKDGQIDGSDLNNPRKMREHATNPDDYGQAAGVYRTVNMPEANRRCIIQLPFVRIEGILFSDVGGLSFSDGQVVDPSQEPGSIYLSGEILGTSPFYGPEGIQPREEQLTIERADRTDTPPAELAQVEVITDINYDGTAVTTSAEADSNGVVDLVFDDRADFVNLKISHDGDNFHTTLDLSTSTTPGTLSFEAGVDNRLDKTPNLGLSVADGEIVTPELTGEFLIEKIENDADTFTIEESSFIDPSSGGDPEQTMERLREASQREQGTREGTDETIAEETNGGGIFGGGGGGGIFGGAKDLVIWGGAAVLGLFALGQLNN